MYICAYILRFCDIIINFSRRRSFFQLQICINIQIELCHVVVLAFHKMSCYRVLFFNFHKYKASVVSQITTVFWSPRDVPWEQKKGPPNLRYQVRRERGPRTLRRTSLNFLKLECKQTHYRKVKGEDSRLFKSRGACIVHPSPPPRNTFHAQTVRTQTVDASPAARKVWKVIKFTVPSSRCGLLISRSPWEEFQHFIAAEANVLRGGS